MSEELDSVPDRPPLEIWLFTDDDSRFPEAYAALLQLGLIPKPSNALSRPLEEIRDNSNIGWQKEDCLVFPVPGKEHMAPTHAHGWGIYRVVFRAGRPDISMSPSIGLKYCYRHTPRRDFEVHHVLENDPRGHIIRQLLPILTPTKVMDHEGTPLQIDL